MEKPLTLEDCIELYNKIYEVSNIHTIMVACTNGFTLVNHKEISEKNRKRLHKYLQDEIICLDFDKHKMYIVL